ncbi:MAG: DUF2961 domain-containing protein [Chitinophagales bacterium]|nr:DUF2961 domain-containing protein [Chitinophagales bacterium]
MCFRLIIFFVLISLKFNLVDASNSINDLSNIDNRFIAYQQANYARDGSNNDGTVMGSFLDTIKSGLVNQPNGTPNGKIEYFLANIEGPARFERFWCADVRNTDALINFYFDGESQPRFSAKLSELFFKKTTVFDGNLAKNISESSGGNTLYASLNIQKNLIITTESNMFYQVSYVMLPKDTIIDSWSNTNDNTQSNLFALSGLYPKSNIGDLQNNRGLKSLATQETKLLFQNNGAGTIDGIELEMPELNFEYANRTFDKGIVRKGVAQFSMKVNQQADSLYLVNKMNKNSILGMLSQSIAVVYVDNQMVGTWSVENFRDFHFWEEERFFIPKSFYQGKNKISIIVQYQSGDIWNEFRYQTICDGVVVDELDIDDVNSRNQHNYIATAIQTGVFSDYVGQATSRYLTPEDIQQRNKQILDSLYIAVYYDNEPMPSIHAPIGLFFGAGTDDAAYMDALLMGNHQKMYYNYLTMPYWKNIRIELQNKSSIAINDLKYNILSTSHSLDNTTHGYLKANFKQENKLAKDSTDFTFLAANGKGKLIAFILQGITDSVVIGPYSYLEGDERIYIDDAQTPYIYGTGTEDIFNGGFYFILDEFCHPLGGLSNSGKNQNRNMYRFYLNDAIYFRKNILANVEHGPTNNSQAMYKSLCFYYWQNDTLYQCTDSVDIGVLSSENSHDYKVFGFNEKVNKSSYFEGSNDKILIYHDGRNIDNSEEFIVSITPQNDGVRLLRTFDYSVKNQKADVFVNQNYVGTWLNAGSNSYQNFREDIFDIPAKFTRNESQLHIKIVNKNEKWTSLKYKIFTLLNNEVITDVEESISSQLSFDLFPNPSSTYLSFSSNENINTINIYQIDGRILQSIHVNARTHTIDVSQYAKGIYIAEIEGGKDFKIAKKFVVE